MALIYLPEYQDSNCVVIQNSDIIRVYDTAPVQNSTVNYKDYFIKSSYIYNEGSQTFGTYSTIPVCINSDRLTTDIYYRNDLPQILLIFAIMSIVMFYFPIKIVLRVFRRYQ